MIPSLYSISLPSIFTDHMVLQRNSKVVFWGWGKPLEQVRIKVSWSGQEYVTSIDPQGEWQTSIQTPDAGGPYSVEIRGFNTIILEDVLIGEVWFCAGQSNMEWTARMGIRDAAKEVQQAHQPNIRMFRVPHRTADDPQIDLHAGAWVSSSPSTMMDFSAVAYFFAREMQAKLNIPIGLIDVSWGGTPIEAWIAGAYVKDNSVFYESAALLDPVPWGPVEASAIYNAMVAPLTRFAISGWLWYQGEANVTNAFFYEQMLTTLITGWREAWKTQLPFYYAQIAPFQYGEEPGGVMIRDAQRRCLSIPQTGMVVTSDIGDTTDIHPLNKQDVGLRLAHLALKDQGAYQAEVSGPLYDRFEVRDNILRVFFTHADGLTSGNAPLAGFEIAGADGRFYPADAFLLEETVILQSELVPVPTAARFAWSNTATPHLYNAAGLPASCFNTTDWKLEYQ